MPVRPIVQAAPVSLPREAAVAWLGLAVALSPALATLLRALPGLPFGWSHLLPVPLLIHAAWQTGGEASTPHRTRGMLLLAIAGALELVGVVGHSATIAWTAIPAGVLGAALFTGCPRPMAACLTLWIVPIPTFLYGATTPQPELAYAALSATLLGGFGVVVHGTVLGAGTEILPLLPKYSGIHLGAMLSMLSWHHSLLERRSLPSALVRAVCISMLGFPLQLMAIILATALLAAGSGELGVRWLDGGVWVATVLTGLLIGELTRAKWRQS